MSWAHSLAHPILVRGGRRLRTLKDAADYLHTHGGDPDGLTLAILAEAARTGAEPELSAATDAVEALLIERGLFKAR